MNPTNEILNKLKKYPSLDYDSGDGYVTVHPVSKDGFTVRFDTVIGESDNPYIVSFEGWHEHFDDAEEALNCFAYGLSSHCRLRVHERGGKAYKWTLETNEDGTWVPYSSTGWFIFPFWRPLKIRCLQNDIINDNKS